MEIIISNNANKPIYEQITSQIKAMIMSGELKAGDAIPSMRALAKSIQVSVITVQKAYEDLQRDGFIETTVGRGSFVSAQNKEFYQEEQQRIAEEHLQIAAEIGRTSNISLEKLTELLTLFYKTEEWHGKYFRITAGFQDIFKIKIFIGKCVLQLAVWGNYGVCWRKWSRKNNDDWLHIKYNKKGQRKDKTVWTGNVRRRHRYA